MRSAAVCITNHEHVEKAFLDFRPYYDSYLETA